jgi:hypothetical protein
VARDGLADSFQAVLGEIRRLLSDPVQIVTASQSLSPPVAVRWRLEAVEAASERPQMASSSTLEKKTPRAVAGAVAAQR